MSSMIPGTGWQAGYLLSDTVLYLPLVCWVSDGAAVPVGYVTNQGGIVPAPSVSGFTGYARDIEGIGVITIPAAPGWWEVSRDVSAPQRVQWLRILAWQISSGGVIVKSIAAPDRTGVVMPTEQVEDVVQFVFDPTRLAAGPGPWPVPPT